MQHWDNPAAHRSQPLNGMRMMRREAADWAMDEGEEAVVDSPAWEHAQEAIEAADSSDHGWIRPFNATISDPAMRCEAVWATGEQCDRSRVTLKGGVLAQFCRWHIPRNGWNTPARGHSEVDQFLEATAIARMEMLRILPGAMDTLEYLITDEGVPTAVRMRATLGLLDRVGIGPQSSMSVQVDGSVAVAESAAEVVRARLDRMAAGTAVITQEREQAQDDANSD